MCGGFEMQKDGAGCSRNAAGHHDFALLAAQTLPALARRVSEAFLISFELDGVPPLPLFTDNDFSTDSPAQEMPRGVLGL